MPAVITIRNAVPQDAAALKLLHRASLWGLGVFDYTLGEIETLVRHVQTLDPALLESGRYYVAEIGGDLAGSGGWSDHAQAHSIMPPANSNGPRSGTPSAKMRAIFVNPKFVRQGVARAILAHAEKEAHAAGFGRADLLATLCGVRAFNRLGYAALRMARLPLADGTRIPFVHMRKSLGVRTKRAA